jgi:hypothetical protein
MEKSWPKEGGREVAGLHLIEYSLVGGGWSSEEAEWMEMEGGRR